MAESVRAKPYLTGLRHLSDEQQPSDSIPMLGELKFGMLLMPQMTVSTTLVH